MLVRDGNAKHTRLHRLTRLTEFLSTRVIGFNKTNSALHFTSEEQMRSLAAECGMQIETMQNDAYTSNTIYLFTFPSPANNLNA